MSKSNDEINSLESLETQITRADEMKLLNTTPFCFFFFFFFIGVSKCQTDSLVFVFSVGTLECCLTHRSYPKTLAFC